MGKLRKKFTGPIAKSASSRLSDTTFFASWPILIKINGIIQLLESWDMRNFLNWILVSICCNAYLREVINV